LNLALSPICHALYTKFCVSIRTIVAIAGEDFAIIASDTRLIQGYGILTREQPKLYKLTDQTVLGCSGCWCDILTYTRTLEARMKVNFEKAGSFGKFFKFVTF
jgi:20S proteasome alpha/beta subunit